MKHVLLYESTEDTPTRAPLHFAAHRSWYEGFHANGTLLMIGVFTDAQDGAPAAMGIFTTREAAEAFVAGDPFVTHGLVRQWQIRPWNEVLAG